ncbi:hypothetical protein ACLPDT_14145, partial [Proteus mirabilis]|uniref:hypothetical protein n=1 Tax=Proteus mirabilis TaxID=584 RepID=UPI003D277D1C
YHAVKLLSKIVKIVFFSNSLLIKTFVLSAYTIFCEVVLKSDGITANIKINSSQIDKDHVR